MKVFVHTFGCQMNEYDSARAAEIFGRRGYMPTDDPKQADVIVVNTCSIRDKAEQKLASALGRYSGLKRHRDRRLVVMGCTAQLRSRELAGRFSAVDLFLGTDRVAELDDWIRAGMPRETRVARADAESYRFLEGRPARVPVSVPVTVQKGCDNFCAYCVVPAARGPQIDRPAAEILAEVDRMVLAGAKEVVLIGQNVNAYGKVGRGRLATNRFAALLREVAARPGLSRVRFTTSHPRDLDVATVQAVADLPVLCPHFHLPVQSGSDRILRKMGRGYSRKTYLEKVEKIRRLIPDAAISTDLIVGFPGETKQDFAETMSLIDEVGFTFSYSFKYSPRPDTRAFDMEDDVSESVKSDRLARLQDKQAHFMGRNLHAWVGRTATVLVEGPSRRGGGQWMGRTETFEIVNFEACLDQPRELTGRSVEMEIVADRGHSLEGRILQKRAESMGGGL